MQELSYGGSGKIFSTSTSGGSYKIGVGGMGAALFYLILLVLVLVPVLRAVSDRRACTDKPYKPRRDRTF